MIDGMNINELYDTRTTMPETRFKKEELANLPSPYMPDFKEDPETDEFFKSEDVVKFLKPKFEFYTLEFELLKQPHQQQIKKQNSRKCSSLRKRKRNPLSHLFISSDDEFFRNSNISDDHFYTIECLRCSKIIRARNLSRLVSNYQKHFNNYLSRAHKKTFTYKEIRHYVKQHVKKPNKYLLYLIPCPEDSNHISHSACGQAALENNLSDHLSKIYPGLPNEFINFYIKQNVKIFTTKRNFPLQKINELKRAGKLKSIYDAATLYDATTLYDVATCKALNNFDQILELLPS